jgi:SEC-C motif
MTIPMETRLLPAVCNSCGTVFPTGFGVPAGPSNLVLRFDNVSHGPCPSCFGFGEIPAEAIDLSRPDVAAILAAPASEASLRRLAGVLARISRQDLRDLRETLASSHGRSAGEVAADVERVAPGLGPVASILRSQTGIGLATWIAAITGIIAIILAVMAQKSDSQPGLTQQQVEQIVRAVTPAQHAQVPPQPGTPARMPGRNQHCYCGSGLKYKKCHYEPSAPSVPAPPAGN